MAILFDGSASVASGAGVANLTTAAWTLGGNNRFLIAGMGWDVSGGAVTYTAVRWGGSGGVDLTQKGATLQFATNAKLAMSSLVAPLTGSRTLYGEVSGTVSEMVVGGVSYTGVRQQSPLDTEATASNTGIASPATATVDVTAVVAGEVVVDFVWARQASAGTMTIATDGGQTQRWEQETIGATNAGAMSEKASSGTVTMSHVITDSPDTISWGIMAVAINPAEMVNRVRGNEFGLF